jgi:hypothetical protein
VFWVEFETFGKVTFSAKLSLLKKSPNYPMAKRFLASLLPSKVGGAAGAREVEEAG